uniref:DNA ligase n=1 Tax=Lygus hesperus TaxID=30085 RepID=A0A0A9WWU7_LYGHE
MSVRGVSCMALVHSTICSSDVIAHVRSHSPILLSFKIYTIQLQKMRKYLVIHFSKFLMTVSHTLVTSTMYICSWRTGGYDTSTTNPCTGSLVCSRATTTIAMVRRYTVRCTHMYVPCAPHTHTHTGMKTHIWSRIGQGEKSNAEYLLTKHVIESIDNKSASIFSLPSCKSFYSPSSGHTLYCSQYFLPKHDPLSLFQKAKVSKMFNTESVDAAASRKGAPGSLFTNSDLSNLYRKLQLAPDPLPPPRLPRDVFIQLGMSVLFTSILDPHVCTGTAYEHMCMHTHTYTQDAWKQKNNNNSKNKKKCRIIHTHTQILHNHRGTTTVYA